VYLRKEMSARRVVLMSTAKITLKNALNLRTSVARWIAPSMMLSLAAGAS
jgi:hypothetical protein